MTIGLNVVSNLRQVRAEFVGSSDKLVKKATTRALNTALDRSQTAARREILKTYNIKPQRTVIQGMKKVRARESSIAPFAVLQVRGARISLYAFEARKRTVRTARGKRFGVSVKVLVGGQRKVVKGGFVGTLQNGPAAGTTGIFRRVGRGRYPIKFARSVSLPQTFSNKVVIAAVKGTARDSFDKEFRRQLQLLSNQK